MAVVFAIPIEICKTRNTQRERKVPDYIFNKMLSRWQTPFEREGFDNIKVVREDERTLRYYREWYATKILDFGNQKNPHHTLTLLADHCWKCMNILYKEDMAFYKVGFWHDVGKIFTQIFDEEGVAHYMGHAEFGSYIALSIGLSWQAA